MQDIIKKYFWIVGALAVIACAALAAMAANHVLAGKFFNDREQPTKFERKQPKRSATAAKTRSKSSIPLAKRNMFCSECEPEEPTEPAVVDPGDPNAVPLTALPLQLVATNVSSHAEHSFATILNTDTLSQGAYWVKATIPGAGEVVKISGKHVDFRNQASKRLERLSLLDQKPVKRTPKPAVASTPSRANPSTSNKDEMAAMLDEGIKKTGDNSYEIDRTLVDKVLASPMTMARGARIVPSVKNGKANGFKLYAIRPSSAFAKIGLRNGDTIHAINGFELTTPDKALEVYTKVKESNNLSVSVTRRGKPVALDYSIR